MGVHDVGERGRLENLSVQAGYGSVQERYNGVGGGRVYKWFSRTVFNSFLSRMRASEGGCTERECMLALAATSAELTKFDMLTQSLKAFAGPQCYAHLDPAGSEYIRVLGQTQEAARHSHEAS
jgi:hypothetical protein